MSLVLNNRAQTYEQKYQRMGRVVDNSYCLLCSSCGSEILYFFDYKTEFISFQNHPKNLNPSYKMVLVLWDSLGREKHVLQQNFIGLIQLLGGILEREKPIL